MIVASLTCPWTGTGTSADPQRPALDGLPLLGWTDTTGTPAANLPCAPNAVVVRATLADQAALDIVAAAPNVTVLSSEVV